MELFDVKNDNGQVLNVESNSSPQPTSKTLLDYNVADNILTYNYKNVNKNWYSISKKVELYARGNTENGVTQRTCSTAISI